MLSLLSRSFLTLSFWHGSLCPPSFFFFPAPATTELYTLSLHDALPISGVVVTYLPWFFFQNRTMFYFYAVTISPFLILSLVYMISKLLDSGVKREIIYLFEFIIFFNFIYFLPIFTGLEIPYSSWLNRMWLPSWI